MLWHDVGRALYVALLHEEFEVGHALVLELLKPLVELHVVLVSAGVVVLAPTGLAPIRLCELEGCLNFAVEDSVPFCGLAVQPDGEDAGLVDGRGLCGLEVVRWLVEEDFGNWMV